MRMPFINILSTFIITYHHDIKARYKMRNILLTLYKRFFFFLLILYSSFFLHKVSYANDLQKKLQVILQENPHIIEKLKLIESYYYQYHLSFGTFKPSVSVSITGNANHSNNVFHQGSNHDLYSKKSSSLNVAQNILDFGLTDYKIEEAKLKIKQAEFELHKSEQDLLFQAISAYINVIRYHHIQQLSKKNIERLQKSLESVAERQSLGEATLTDVAQAESRLAIGEADLVVVNNNFEKAWAKYKEIFGEEPSKILTPYPLLQAYDNILQQQETLQTEMERYNIDLQSMENTIALSQTSVASASSQFLPSLDASANVTRTYSSQTQAVRHQDVVQAGITLSIPLYKQGKLYDTYYAAKKTVDSLHYKKRALRRSLQQKMTEASTHYENTTVRITATKKALKATQLVFQALESEYNAGSKTFLNFLDAEQDVFTASINLVNAEHDAMIAKYSIFHLIGYITPHKLMIDSLYQPTINTDYNESKYKFLYDIVK